MATSFSVRLGLHQLGFQPELPALTSNNKTKNLLRIRISTVTLPSITACKIDGRYGSKMLESNSSCETYQQTQIQPLVDLLHDCAESRSVREAKSVHGYVLKSNFADEYSLLLLNHVAHAYSKCSDLKAARVLFDKMSQRNVYSWTVMIVGSTENGFFNDGFEYFCEMLEHGLFPDGFAYSAIIQTCIGLKSVDLGKMMHAQIVIRGFTSHTFVATSLLNMYAKLGKVYDSCQVFNTMTEHSEVSWNAMISGLTSNGLHAEAFTHFITMKKEEFTPNIYTFVGVLKAISMLGNSVKGKEIHKYASELGMESNILVGTALIDMYSKCGDLSDARYVFNMNFINCRLNTPWNAMISGYSQSGCSEQALKLYIKMCCNDIKSDLYTYCSVFDAIADLKCLKFGKEVHGNVLKSGHDLTCPSVKNAIMDAYSKCGSLEDARKVFDSMEEKDVVSWTTLLTAYSQCSDWEEALIIFSHMREEGFMPNHFTFSSVLTACAGLCFLEYGRQVHGLLYKACLIADEYTESALVDMYAKCGSIIDAGKVFNSISNPDIISWTAMISAYAQHGSVSCALQLFTRMEQLEIRPNAVTLLCVLFACSHGGMVEEGLRYFQSMEESYGVVPEMEHYACIVDLLGRVGRLHDAFEFIEKMPIEPTEMVWQTLLGACMIHGNVELGEIAAKKILSIRPEFPTTYILLSNMYMQTGNLRIGIDLRNVMREQGVKKEPGYSWISVEGRIHKFYAGDRQHPQKDDVYVKLEELREKAKVMGYVPDLRYVLHAED